MYIFIVLREVTFAVHIKHTSFLASADVKHMQNVRSSVCSALTVHVYYLYV
jgi:hypothetical protein